MVEKEKKAMKSKIIKVSESAIYGGKRPLSAGLWDSETYNKDTSPFLAVDGNPTNKLPKENKGVGGEQFYKYKKV